MTTIRIGVICPSEIAFRRFMPALKKHEGFEFVGIAYANDEEWFGKKSECNDHTVIENEHKKASIFADTYGGRVFDSYMKLLSSDEIDAVYIPLPPALHHKWAKKALEYGKHVLLEKPFTTSLKQTDELIALARKKKLALHENYMFQYHSQLDYIKQAITDKKIGELRSVSIQFGFPFRGANDFRYNKSLGGGALLDCSGYTIKLASLLLGDSARVVTSQLNYTDGFDVDIYGSGTIVNSDGLTAQLSFGMDNSYKCDLELWGSTGTLYTNRILTAPEGFEPLMTIKKGNGEITKKLSADDTFAKSIVAFSACVENSKCREENYKAIKRQAVLVDEFVRGTEK
ncbi:hypothetical protein EDD70_2893 [Hydrogenoanaerobacterium saccharovorans]|uniref:Uncharacterized protein n=1 Tax=Hydrogenoanaerobacterium saccharovorans TaxID=474960 RepID=A0A1H8EEK3_9FIRM|nr:Gfo/Idh/MocA family oxidoreductase [Hydrogenoanaerobacterium saccharovorans]RPF42150.1 hypothetical protein EDD70_2893 [Hydrogenoanaerobacterium saccharovorans]SEN17903.1 hypothetical protein SAMN05216180_2989 [Hydrogenoanaerobacterium saccharovorans]